MIRNDVGYSGFYNNPFLNGNLYAANNTYKNAGDESVPGKNTKKEEKKIDYNGYAQISAFNVENSATEKRETGLQYTLGINVLPFTGDYAKDIAINGKIKNYSEHKPDYEKTMSEMSDNKPKPANSLSFGLGISFKDIFSINFGRINTPNINDNGRGYVNDFYIQNVKSDVFASLFNQGESGYDNSLLGVNGKIQLPVFSKTGFVISYTENEQADAFDIADGKPESIGSDNYSLNTGVYNYFTIDKHSLFSNFYITSGKLMDQEDVDTEYITNGTGVSFDYKKFSLFGEGSKFYGGIYVNLGKYSIENGKKTYAEDYKIIKEYRFDGLLNLGYNFDNGVDVKGSFGGGVHSYDVSGASERKIYNVVGNVTAVKDIKDGAYVFGSAGLENYSGKDIETGTKFNLKFGGGIRF